MSDMTPKMSDMTPKEMDEIIFNDRPKNPPKQRRKTPFGVKPQTGAQRRATKAGRGPESASAVAEAHLRSLVPAAENIQATLTRLGLTASNNAWVRERDYSKFEKPEPDVVLAPYTFYQPQNSEHLDFIFGKPVGYSRFFKDRGYAFEKVFGSGSSRYVKTGYGFYSDFPGATCDRALNDWKSPDSDRCVERAPPKGFERPPTPHEMWRQNAGPLINNFLVNTVASAVSGTVSLVTKGFNTMTRPPYMFSREYLWRLANQIDDHCAQFRALSKAARQNYKGCETVTCKNISVRAVLLDAVLELAHEHDIDSFGPMADILVSDFQREII